MCNIEKFKYAMKNYNAEKANKVLRNLILDLNNLLCDDFEGLCESYINGSDDHRKWMDETLYKILGMDMCEIADLIMEDDKRCFEGSQRYLHIYTRLNNSLNDFLMLKDILIKNNYHVSYINGNEMFVPEHEAMELMTILYDNDIEYSVEEKA